MKSGNGVLLPVASLYNEYGIGSLGKEAYDFIDVLKSGGFSYWQVLPLTPTGYGDSPYQSCSAFALNYYFIDLEALAGEGLLTESDLKRSKREDGRIDYGAVFLTRIPLLKLAFSRFDSSNADFAAFKAANPYSADFALYMAAKEKNYYTAWYDWKDEYKFPTLEFLERFKAENEESIDFWMFTQFKFFCQWEKLKNYAADSGVLIIGDIPIYVAYDSAEMWLHPEYFITDKNKRPIKVAGVPPDYFSQTGQLWGNPVYDWKKMKQDGYKWWHDRIEHALKIYDYVRIDHFRGFDRFYTIPLGAPDAKTGKWEKGPGYELFKGYKNGIIAEDLGLLDAGVYKLLKKTGYPGMKVLSFSFDGKPDNPYKPSNYIENCVAYTGTHDNEPFLQLIISQLRTNKKAFLADINSELKKGGLKEFDENASEPEEIALRLMTLLKCSKAKVKIFPAQDLLLLGKESRINTPSLMSEENWSWRLEKGQVNGILKN